MTFLLGTKMVVSAFGSASFVTGLSAKKLPIGRHIPARGGECSFHEDQRSLRKCKRGRVALSLAY
jgi:hypothetical protein